jgi:branched-chain amino acid transport system substrate-binding protein
MRKQLIRCSLSVTLFALSLPAAFADETLKIAVVAPLSGPAALWGQTLRGAVVLAANEANEAGGLKVGGTTYKVEVTSYDDQFQIDKTVAAANRIAFQDGIKFVIGTVYSPGVLAAKPIFERAKILSFVGGWSRKILDPASNFTYRVGDSVVEFMPPIMEWMSKSGAVKGKTVVLFGQNDEGGIDNRRIAEENYPKFGFEIVGAESYERTTKDFQPALTRLLPLNPAFIDIGPSPPALAGLIVRQAREMGFKGQFVKLGGAGPREIVTAAGKEAAEGLLQFIPADPDTEAFRRLNAAYQKLYGNEMDTSGLVSYDTAKLLFASIVKAGTTSDTAKVKEALDSTKTFPSVVGGKLELAGKQNYGVDRQFNGPFHIGQIVDGRVKIVASCDETCRSNAQPPSDR